MTIAEWLQSVGLEKYAALFEAHEITVDQSYSDYRKGATAVLRTTGDMTEWGAPPPDQVIAHTNLYWANHRAPGRTAGTVPTEAVDFPAASG